MGEPPGADMDLRSKGKSCCGSVLLMSANNQLPPTLIIHGETLGILSAAIYIEDKRHIYPMA